MKEYLKAINVLGLRNTHLIFKKKKVSCARLFDTYTSSSSEYGSIINKFLSKSCDYKYKTKYKYKNFTQDEIKNKIFSKTNPCIKIYYENDPKTFMASNFVENYCQNSLENILSAFSFINGINNFARYSNRANCAFDQTAIKQIFDALLIGKLAKIFCLIDSYETQSIKYFNGAFEQLMQFGDGVLYFVNNHIHSLNKEDLDNSNFSSHTTSQKKIIIAFWQSYRVELYKIFIDKTKLIELLTATPELTAAIFDDNDLERYFYTCDTISTERYINSFFLEKNFYYILDLIRNKNGFNEKQFDFNVKIHNIPNYVCIEI